MSDELTILTRELPAVNVAYRDNVMRLERKLMSTPGFKVGKELEEYCPVRHSFGDGLYVREVFAPKGALIVTKLHKKAHPYFVLRGVISVLTEQGPRLVAAPFYDITAAGTKRICYIHEDTTWVTVHATDKTNLEEIEDEVIAKSYEEFDAVHELPAHVINFIEAQGGKL